MAIQYVNTGSGANAGDGDSLRTAFYKINNNFTELSSLVTTDTSVIIVNSFPPTTSTEGTIWYDTISGRNFIYYDGFWVDAAPPAVEPINLTTVSSHILPGADLTYDLGSTSSQWRSLYVGTNTIYIGGIPVSISNDSLVVNGQTIPSFNQNLNTTDDPQFNSISLESGDINITLGSTFNVKVTQDINTTHTLRLDISGDLSIPNYILFKGGTYIGDEPGGGPDFRIVAPLGYGVTVEADSDIEGTNRVWGFGTDGNLDLAGNLHFPDGAEIRDVSGNLRLRGAPGEVATIQGLDPNGFVDSSVKTFYNSGSYVTVNTNIDAGSPEYIWTFDYNGNLTFPGGMTIETQEGGGPKLIIDGKGNYIDIRDSGTILIGYNSSGIVQIGNPEGGTLTEILSEKVKFLLQAVPESSIGSVGDVPGLIAFNGSYTYYCAGTYNGVDHIWKRVSWSNDTW